MNVAENLLLQQMQAMANMPKAPSGGSKDQAGSFQDMMNQAGQDTSVNTGKDTPAAEKPVQNDKPGTDTDKTSSDAPQQKKPGEDEKAVELQGNPNVVNYVLDMFRPEIVDVSEPEVTAEIPVEAVIVEAVPEAVEEIAVPVAEAAPVEEAAVPVEDAPVEVREAPEQAPQAETVREAAKPVETERPAEAPREAAPEELEKTTDTGELKEVRPAEETEDDTDEVQSEAAEVPQQVFHDVKAAPVKVGETYETVDTQDAKMDDQLAEKILQAAQNGAEKVQIQLTPENLGTITIELAKSADGALQVVLHTSNSRAAGLLGEHLDSLHAALQNHGSNQTVHVEVQRGQESQEQHMFQQADPDGRGQQRQQQQENKQEQEDSGEDFLQKLRLGLAGLENL